MSEFDPFPPGDPPSLDALVAAIAAGFLPDERARATTTLRDQVLPWQLRSLATHPHPRRLAEVVYEGVTDRLRPVAPAGRLAILDALACEITADRLVAEATALAVARYLADHPLARGGDAWRADAARWSTLTPTLREAEIAARLKVLDALVTSAPAGCDRAIGQKTLHARLALGSARTGSFATAAGMLLDFLRATGEHPQELDVH